MYVLKDEQQRKIECYKKKELMKVNLHSPSTQMKTLFEMEKWVVELNEPLKWPSVLTVANETCKSTSNWTESPVKSTTSPLRIFRSSLPFECHVLHPCFNTEILHVEHVPVRIDKKGDSNLWNQKRNIFLQQRRWTLLLKYSVQMGTRSSVTQPTVLSVSPHLLSTKDSYFSSSSYISR